MDLNTRRFRLSIQFIVSIRALGNETWNRIDATVEEPSGKQQVDRMKGRQEDLEDSHIQQAERLNHQSAL